MMFVSAVIALFFVTFISFPISCEGLKCYECSAWNEQSCTATASNCPMCMVFRNEDTPDKFDRRCCWWGCGAPNQISEHAGRPTYFCDTDECNGLGSEEIFLSANSSVSKTTSTSSTMIMTTTTTATSTTTVTTEQSSSQCFDCSGSDCGKEGSSMSMHCPKCMVYRNPDDETKIERRCCWWGCGPSNAVSTYNGIETYFCTGHKCNGYAAESVLSPPVTTTTVSTRPTTTTSTFSTMASLTTTVTSSSGSCSLNCRNGGTPETEDGCFCYCLENTYGRECENVDCAQPDIDPEVCSLENQSLCQESETFAFECLHRCGKC